MKTVFEFGANSYHHEDIRLSKKIYLDKDYELMIVCPSCGDKSFYDHCVPIVTRYPDKDYCHSHGCDSCGYEDSEKLYSIVEIKETTLVLELNNYYEIIPFKYELVQLMSVGDDNG